MPTPASSRPRSSLGLTMVELLIAASMGAVIMVGAAHTTGMFGQNLTELLDEQDTELEEAMSLIAHDVRYAWQVSTPNPHTLNVVDATGLRTQYTKSDTKLEVVRPDGSTGTLLEDVRGVTFTTETIERLREDAPLQRTHSFWTASEPSSPAAVEVFPAGRELALGFSVDSSSIFQASAVPEAPEQLIEADLGTFRLPIAVVLDGGGDVEITLYRSWTPGDARPEGPALASTSFPMRNLPTTPSSFWDPVGLQTVTATGRVWDWWVANPQYELVTTTPTADVPVDLAALAATIQPGRSYTLVIRVVGNGNIALRTHSLASADGSEVALKADVSSPWVAQAATVPRVLTGRAMQTDTTVRDAVSRVFISITPAEGDLLTTSASIAGQMFVRDPWLGNVPGEIPVLSGVTP